MADQPANSRVTKRRGSWKPGQSGNPNGRPKLPPEIREIAKAGSVKAISRAVELIDHEDPNVALKAINTVLDRGYGKPAQSHELTGPGGGPIQSMDLTKATDDQLEALASLLGPLAAAAGGDADPDQGGAEEEG